MVLILMLNPMYVDMLSYIHMRNTYILLTWILQNGLQPIHHAAQEGHEDILMILVNDFNVRPDAVTYVRRGILHI